jgi:8-oxo-dGTP pyrophosphatase MutT (NUDIX family)
LLPPKAAPIKPETTMGMSDFYRNLRTKIGPELLLIPAVAAVIRDDEGRILVQQKHDGSWSLPAGAVEPGETPSRALVREVREETGLRVRPARVAGVVGGRACRVQYPNGHEVEYVVTVFDCAVVGGALLEMGEETLRLAFLSQDQALSRLDFPYPAGVFDGSRPAAFFSDEGT